MHSCKFCSYEWTEDRPCENGVIRDDDGYIVDSTYCGNQACPACGACQGRTYTTADAMNSSISRAIHERREFSFVRSRETVTY